MSDTNLLAGFDELTAVGPQFKKYPGNALAEIEVAARLLPCVSAPTIQINVAPSNQKTPGT